MDCTAAAAAAAAAAAEAEAAAAAAAAEAEVVVAVAAAVAVMADQGVAGPEVPGLEADPVGVDGDADQPKVITAFFSFTCLASVLRHTC